jgi:hypothetical protein
LDSRCRVDFRCGDRWELRWEMNCTNHYPGCGYGGISWGVTYHGGRVCNGPRVPEQVSHTVSSFLTILFHPQIFFELTQVLFLIGHVSSPLVIHFDRQLLTSFLRSNEIIAIVALLNFLQQLSFTLFPLNPFRVSITIYFISNLFPPSKSTSVSDGPPFL